MRPQIWRVGSWEFFTDIQALCNHVHTRSEVGHLVQRAVHSDKGLIYAVAGGVARPFVLGHVSRYNSAVPQ